MQRGPQGLGKLKGSPTKREAVFSPTLGQRCCVTNHPKTWLRAGIELSCSWACRAGRVRMCCRLGSGLFCVLPHPPWTSSRIWQMAGLEEAKPNCERLCSHHFPKGCTGPARWSCGHMQRQQVREGDLLSHGTRQRYNPSLTERE